MRASILAIGDELLLGENLDTNSAWIAQQLTESGVSVRCQRTVGDDVEAIVGAIRLGMDRADIVVMTGGLGPTDDDLTRYALASVIDPDGELVSDPIAEQHLRKIFDARGRSMPQSNARQTMRPHNAAFLGNPHGTAMGLFARHGQNMLFALPGPPREMKPMWTDYVVPRLRIDRNESWHTAHVKCFGLGESAAAELLNDRLRRKRDPQIGITASLSIVTARIRSSQSPDLVLSDAREIREIWGAYAFDEDGATLPEAVLNLLRQQGRSVSTAESCTGGMLGSLLVDVPGSSDAYNGGWVTYSNAMKHSCLGVEEGVLEEHGAVSEPVAAAMATGALKQSDADYALSITGIAGPEGGALRKPVGLVFIGLADRTAMGPPLVRRFRFRGDRSAIRERSALTALQILRLRLKGLHDDLPLLWDAPQTSKRAGA